MEPQQQINHQQNPQSSSQQQQQMNEDMSGSGKGNFLCRQSSTRWTPTTEQIRILKDLYYNNGVRSPSAEQIQRISARLRQYGKIEGKNVFYWFQNHKARERQKKRFTCDSLPVQRSGVALPLPNNVVVGRKTEDSFHNKYPNFTPAGVSSPSSSAAPGVFAVGQMGNFGYGSVTMEKSFRDCSISAGVSGGGGGSMTNNFGWVDIDPYAAPYTLYDNKNSFHETLKEEQYHEAPERETLPLFPVHKEDYSNGGFGNMMKPSYEGYYSNGWYRSDDGYVGSRTSLELSLNSYTLADHKTPPDY